MFSIVKVARDQTQPGSLLSRLGGKMRDPGNEVEDLVGLICLLSWSHNEDEKLPKRFPNLT